MEAGVSYHAKLFLVNCYASNLCFTLNILSLSKKLHDYDSWLKTRVWSLVICNANNLLFNIASKKERVHPASLYSLWTK